MKCHLLFCNSLELSDPKWQCFFCFVFQKWLLPRGRQNFSDFTASTPTKQATALFAVQFAPSSPLSLSRMSNYLLDSKFSCFFVCFFKLFYFHVDVISKLCLWLSLFVFDWSTQRVGFSKNHGHGYWLSFWKKKEESAVYVEWVLRRKKSCYRLAPSPLRWWKCVYVCVNVCECVFLCANSQRAEAVEQGGSRMWRVETLYLGHLCVRRGFLCPLLLFLFPPYPLVYSSQQPLYPHPPPLCPFPSPNTPLKRGKN